MPHASHLDPATVGPRDERSGHAAATRMRPVTILHLMESSDPGGAEKMLVSLVEGLDPARYRSVIVTWRDGWLNGELARRGVPTFALPLRRRLDPSWLVRCMRLMRRWRIGLLHAHEFTMNTYGSMVARLTGVPIVATVHGKGYYAEKPHRRIAYRFVARSAFRMVAVSDDVRRFLVERIGAHPGRLVTVHNGVAPAGAVSGGGGGRVRRGLGIPAAAPVVGAVGNLLPVKGHTYLLHAAARLAGRVPGLTVLLCGQPVLRAELEAEARRLGIADRVHVLGFRDDVPALLDAMDVFVLPSLSEGLSLSLLEAMAAGKPVVATAVGGSPELVRNGETGFLVPPRDPERLAERILTLLEERDLACALGEAARRRVFAEFSLAAMVARYEAIYEAGLGTACS